MRSPIIWAKINSIHIKLENYESSLKLKGRILPCRNYGVVSVDGLLPKTLFIMSKTFLIPVVGRIPGALKRALRVLPQAGFKALVFHFAKIAAQKSFNDRSKGFGQKPAVN